MGIDPGNAPLNSLIRRPAELPRCPSECAGDRNRLESGGLPRRHPTCHSATGTVPSRLGTTAARGCAKAFKSVRMAGKSERTDPPRESEIGKSSKRVLIIHAAPAPRLPTNSSMSQRRRTPPTRSALMSKARLSLGMRLCLEVAADVDGRPASDTSIVLNLFQTGRPSCHRRPHRSVSRVAWCPSEGPDA
jgi:hypothetical protein